MKLDWYRVMTPEEASVWWKNATPEQRHCFHVLLRREMSLAGRAFRDACASAAVSMRAFADAVAATMPDEAIG